MQAIIEGRRYNTDTAEEIASTGSNYGRGDFRSFEETLYRTKKGNWFLAGEGGPMTHYSRQVGDSTTGGRRIIPMTPSEAKDWLERDGFYAELEKYFAEHIEDA